jgi:hypothetical protein
MFKKIVTGALVAATLVGATIATTGTAQARYYGNGGVFAAGAGIGLIGGLLAGSAYNNRHYDDGYYGDYRPVYYRHCYIASRQVAGYYGWHWEHVKVCN